MCGWSSQVKLGLQINLGLRQLEIRPLEAERLPFFRMLIL